MLDRSGKFGELPFDETAITLGGGVILALVMVGVTLDLDGAVATLGLEGAGTTLDFEGATITLALDSGGPT